VKVSASVGAYKIWRRLFSFANISGQTQPGDMAMEITQEEALKAGRQSILIWAVVSAALCVLLLIIGNGNFGTPPEHAAPPATTSPPSNP
jgi:hypothetical protein